ncbi:MAG: PASTA domain-containing protein [Actinomycetota bacterium]
MPALALAALLIALPASASAPETQAPCAAPTFYGYVDDFEAWFRYPPGAEGRNAEHITEGVVDVEITDLSSEQNFHLSDITWHNWSHSTDIAGQGVECWTVEFEATETVNGDYEWKSDPNPDVMRGLITAHPGVPPPPPPPPPPGAPPAPPPPPAPPTVPDFIFTVGPDQRIGVFYSDGRPLSRIPPGTYTIQVHDLSTSHDFHLTGPGVNKKTSVEEIEHPIWTVTFVAGTYRFNCDVHAAMKGSFVVAVGVPPPTRCRVPRVIGLTLIRARRAIRARHCSVGSVRYRRSARARNKVLSQTPRAGRRLARGARVNLIVSRGSG